MIRLVPFGAIGEVTGSATLVETGEARVLVDCGMFQGARDAEERNASLAPIDPAALDAVLLTHAHLDHSGRLPLLARARARKPIYATPASVDLAMVLLEDAAGIQEMDAKRENRVRRRAGLPAVEPLYAREDVERVSRRWRAVDYETPKKVAPGITARFFEAGHILGSASLELTVRDGAGDRVVVFSGDLGAPGAPILRDPVRPSRADLVVLESTYGDREHPPREETVRELVEILRDAVRRRRRVLIPAFAVGRTQLLLYHVAEAVRARRLPADFPIYLDSPTARRATEVYAKHRELYDTEALGLARTRQLERDLRGLRIVESAEESKALNETDQPCAIIAGSGMCEGGRIRHHLKHHLWRENATVVIAGYMAEGTLGRRLADGAGHVQIFGETVVVHAEVRVLSGFSAHAGRSDLVGWLADVAPARPRVVLNHGEDAARAGLAAAIGARYGIEAERPARGDAISLG